MNKYIVKVAEMMSDENKQVAKTFAIQTAAGVPAHIAGGAIGGAIGAKLENKGMALASKMGRVGKWTGMASKGGTKAVGVGLGMAAVGGLADLASLKHSLHGKVKKS